VARSFGGGHDAAMDRYTFILAAVERLLTTDVSRPVTEAARRATSRILGEEAVGSVSAAARRAAELARTDLGALRQRMLNPSGTGTNTVAFEQMTAAQRQAYSQALDQAEQAVLTRRAPTVTNDLGPAGSRTEVLRPSQMSLPNDRHIMMRPPGMPSAA